MGGGSTFSIVCAGRGYYLFGRRDKFYLVINGIKQNPTPQTNVRVDGLVATNYRTRIIFEDTSKEAMNNNVYTQNALSHEWVENTYKIKRTKKGDLKLRLFSSTPVPPTYTPAPDMCMIHYDGSVQVQTMQTTQTTVGNNGNVNISVASPNMSAPNVNMNVSIPNVNMNMSVPNARVNIGNNGGNNAPPRPPVNNTRAVGSSDCHWAMDNNAFQTFLKGMKSELSSDVQERSAYELLANNCLSTDQVIDICKVIYQDMDKVKFAKTAYPRTVDQGSYMRVTYVIEHPYRKQELETFIKNGGK